MKKDIFEDMKDYIGCNDVSDLPYISKLSLRKLYDEYGNVYMVVDSELKGRIQAAVMDMIANFEIIVI